MNDEAGILYARKLCISSERGLVARSLIGQALEKIEVLKQSFGFDIQELNPARSIVAKMTVNWANLIDSRAEKLTRYGPVNPDLESILDPTVNTLAQIALELSSLFDETE